MRLYYDQYSTRERSEALLIAADMLAAVCALVFATGAMGAIERAPWDVGLLVVWACIPRALAKALSWLDPPSYGYRTYLFSLSLALLVAVLIVAGWETINSLRPRHRSLEVASAVPIFLAWAAGLTLFQPRAYLLFDFMLWAVMLVGLKDSRPLPHLWLPLFLGAIFLSSTVRQSVHGVFHGHRHPPVNLQNARASATLAAAAAVAVFVAAYAPIHGGIDFPVEEGAGESGARRIRVAAPGGGAPGEAASLAHVTAPAGTAATPDDSASRAAAAPGAATVGFTYRVVLKDLSLARYDEREVLRVKATGDAGGEWRPAAGGHWKAVSFSRFNPDDDSWNEETVFVERPWPRRRVLEREVPRSVAGRDGIELECRYVTPVCRNIVQPYFTSQVGSRAFVSYRESALGDVFPRPAPEAGTRFTVRTVLAELAATPRQSGAGEHPDRRHLEVPPARAVGVDIAAYARVALAGAGAGIPAKVHGLRRHFSAEFKYSRNALWRAGDAPLAAFLQRERIGNCTYFATAAALVLRASGVSTRLAAGFLGAEWDGVKNEAIVRNSTAHAWVEVYFPGEGWHPFEATAGVPLDPSFQPPPEELARLREGARAAPRQDASLEPPEAPERAPDEPRATADVGVGNSGPNGPDDPEGVVRAGTPQGIDAANDMGGSWIELAPIAAESPDAEPDLDSLADGPASGRARMVQDAVAPDEIASEETAEGSAYRLDAARVRQVVRAAIAGVGAVALGLLLASFFRPRRVEAEAEEGTGEDNRREAARFDAAWLGTLDESAPGDRVLLEYVRLQQALERTRSHRQPHQTPAEHARRVGRGLSQVEEAFAGLHHTLYRLLYAGEEIDRAESIAAVRCCRRLRRLLG